MPSPALFQKELVRALDDREVRVREAAARALAKPSGSFAAAALRERLDEDRWPIVRGAAALALAEYGADQESDRALIAALDDEAWLVRRDVALALGRRKVKSASEALAERLDDDQERFEVRVAAARALGDACSVGAADALTKHARRLQDPLATNEARAIGLAALASLANLGLPDLRQRLAPCFPGTLPADLATRRRARSARLPAVSEPAARRARQAPPHPRRLGLKARPMTSHAALVTGASGFIGSNLVRRLVERGERVKAFVRAGADLRPFAGLPADRFELAYGDVTVVHTVYRALSGCDRIYHVASPFQFWAKDPQQIIETATLGTRATLTACKRRGIENIVVTSSVGVLGVSSTPEAFDETHALNLSDPEPYVASKIEAEKVVDSFLDDGLPIVSVLPGTTFGPGDWKPTPTGARCSSTSSSPRAFRFRSPRAGSTWSTWRTWWRAHILAMEHGEVGARYILGGDNLKWAELFQTLADITGLAEPGEPKSQGPRRALRALARAPGLVDQQAPARHPRHGARLRDLVRLGLEREGGERARLHASARARGASPAACVGSSTTATFRRRPPAGSAWSSGPI